VEVAVDHSQEALRVQVALVAAEQEAPHQQEQQEQ
jgi:hypothetical protein